MKVTIDTGNTKGVIRKIDDLSRITIPKEFKKDHKVGSVYGLENGVYIRFIKED